MPIDPSESYELSDFGFGPFPEEGGTPVYPPHPQSMGYGGSSYGFFPYGSRSQFPTPPIPVSGGYGGSPYGYSSYGAKDLTAPTVTGAVSLDGFRIEIFFGEEMQRDAALEAASSYSLASLSGGAAVTVTSVAQGVLGPLGTTSVIITHSGTTLGGVYRLTVVDLVDLSLNAIEDSGVNTTDLITLGDPPSFTVTPLSGSQLGIQFSHDMLDNGIFPGITETGNYVFTPSPAYPITLTPLSITHPYSGDPSQLLLDVQGMTSLSYTLEVEPASAILFDGSVLPSASTQFVGTEVGTGTTTIAGGSLYLAKGAGVSYGWNFEDLTGKIAPAGSFRMDFSFDASLAVFTPLLFDAVLGAVYINDGGVEAVLFIERITGQDVITVESGGYSASVDAAWSTGPSTLTLVRNQQAGIYAFLFNGVPLVSTAVGNFTGAPTIPVGVQLILGTTYQVAGLRVSSLNVTASQTVFSAAWNFLHNQQSIFTGSAALASATLLTERGPLVKGWGDGTPAAEQDVTVTINGTEVVVSSVNPYIGEITLAVPVPFTPAGTNLVEVDYTWFPVPTMEMAGLNVEGLVLNKWDNPHGLLSTPITDTLGAIDSASRFPMRVVLGPIERPQPKRIGHRYLGFELGYSALLNSPTTLLLNQDPHSLAVEDFTFTPTGVGVGYDGTTTPVNAEIPWSLQGVDSGSLNADGETYLLRDLSSGSFGEGTEGFYYQALDLSFPSSVVVGTRFSAASYTLNGVFGGLGFGLHNNRRLFLAGCLEVNGVQHIGLLKKAGLPHLSDSWELGPKTEATILNSLQCSLVSAEVPTSLEAGNRFQVLTGPQAGIYTLESFVSQSDGTTTVTVASTTPFPADPYYYGNDTAEVIFEVVWQGVLSTYRMVVDTLDGGVQVFVSGEISSLAISLGTMPELALAAQLPFMLSTDGAGQIFWGSLDRIATNESDWSFFRYGSTPQQTTYQSPGIVVSTDLATTTPEDDPNSEWFRTQDFGYSELDSVSGGLLLKSLSADTGLDTSFGYGRIEPFLSPEDHVDFDGVLRVDSGTLGFGDAQVSLWDTHREVRFGTILYRENVGLTPYRQLISLPTVSLSGLQTPEVLGWTSSVGNSLAVSARGKRVLTSQALTQAGTWYTDLDVSGLNFTDTLGRILEARVQVSSYTANVTGDTGIIFGCEAGGRLIALTWIQDGTAKVALTSDGTPLQEYAFDWEDSELHTYRVLVDVGANTVTLVLDDTVQAPTLALSAFTASATSTLAFLGAFGTGTAHAVEWDAFSVSAQPPTDAKRTLGIWLGGDTTDLDNFRIPRSDGTSASNSVILATPVEMDWRSNVEFRLHRDANWGVILLRPDLGDPPGYLGQFTTDTTDPSQGWISVEYAELPIQGALFGKVLWGSLPAASISQQRWLDARYRIYKGFTDDYRSPQNMVFNKSNVISSGESTRDTTPELVVVTSLTSTLVSLRPTNIFAESIYRVLEGDSTLIPYGEWSFDPDTQILTLLNPLSEANALVTVVFKPGKPYTTTYLEAQPLLDSITLLNEGTPPIPKHQQGASTVVLTAGANIVDPDGDSILNSPYLYVQDVADPEALYADMEFLEVTDDGEEGLISSFCDDTTFDHGLLGWDFSGSAFQDVFKTPIGDYTGIVGTGLSQGVGVGTAPSPYVQNPFSGAPVFFASGGNYRGSSIGPGSISVVIPNYPGTGKSAINKGLTWDLHLRAVTSGGAEIALEEDASFGANPDVVSAVLETAALYSRVGPWGGLASLSLSLVAGGSSLTGSAFLVEGGSGLPPAPAAVILSL